MGMIGGGSISALGGAKVVQLSSSTDKLEVKDQDGFVVFSVDSSGNLKIRGTVSKV